MKNLLVAAMANYELHVNSQWINYRFGQPAPDPIQRLAIKEFANKFAVLGGLVSLLTSRYVAYQYHGRAHPHHHNPDCFIGVQNSWQCC